ncbi:hypothetical protein [Thermomonospora umbrina]|uniref:PH (Pleckstrin Homology) domain-containing protein n=1 Tax=Thermomonospora umbrina TaxID=111806 RepID=A0A3D9SJ72_9ACTN|nr:hypothetical protein [Thermomonospora umbrina]REE95998.1 hypothetical protein DFJ69_1418 [Thermomonospora umbrina]
MSTSLSLRPSRRPLLWVLPAIAVLAAAVVTMGDQVSLLLVVMGMAGASLSFFRLALLQAFGRTEANADGIANRLVLRTARVPWRELDRFLVMPTVFGATVKIVRIDGRRVTLAAPRSGLLGRDPEMAETLRALRVLAQANGGGNAAVEELSGKVARVFYVGLIAFAAWLGISQSAPWLEPWWPGRAEATSLPDPCAVAAPYAAQLVPGASPRKDRDRFPTKSMSCLWKDGPGHVELQLTYGLWGRDADVSATDRAWEDFVDSRDASYWEEAEPVRGVGDAAVHLKDGAQVRRLILRANMVIELRYHNIRDRPAGTALDGLSRAAVAHVRAD